MANLGPIAARVDIEVADNTTFYYGFQFDPPPWQLGGYSQYFGTGATGCYTGPQWNFENQNFRMDIKRRYSDTGTLLSMTGAQGVSTGEIVVDDPQNRVLHFDVPESVLTASLIPGNYVYDFIMFDDSTPPIRQMLMQGIFKLTHGVTGG
jgi:hypothetical protein